MIKSYNDDGTLHFLQDILLANEGDNAVNFITSCFRWTSSFLE